MFIKVKIGTFNWPAVRAPANIFFVIYNTNWVESECSEIDWDKFDREWEAYRTRIARPVSSEELLKTRPELKAIINAQNSDSDRSALLHNIH